MYMCCDKFLRRQQAQLLTRAYVSMLKEKQQPHVCISIKYTVQKMPVEYGRSLGSPQCTMICKNILLLCKTIILCKTIML